MKGFTTDFLPTKDRFHVTDSVGERTRHHA
jgi:hypothetical protein